MLDKQQIERLFMETKTYGEFVRAFRNAKGLSIANAAVDIGISAGALNRAELLDSMKQQTQIALACWTGICPCCGGWMEIKETDK